MNTQVLASNEVRPMTGPEKIIAKACGLSSVAPGDIVFPNPHMVMVHDNVLPSIKKALDSIGIDQLANPEKVVLVTDHEVLYGSPQSGTLWCNQSTSRKSLEGGSLF
jgi:homoaconitase/3-isopropylmalate dehydratase large subunit